MPSSTVRSGSGRSYTRTRTDHLRQAVREFGQAERFCEKAKMHIVQGYCLSSAHQYEGHLRGSTTRLLVKIKSRATRQMLLGNDRRKILRREKCLRLPEAGDRVE